jgi:hypothetical protein
VALAAAGYTREVFVTRLARRPVFLAMFAVLACASGSGRAAFAQVRIGAGHAAVPRPVPVMPLPRNIPRRSISRFRPFFPVLVPPSVWLFGGLSLGSRPGWDFRPFWNQNCDLYRGWVFGCNGLPTYYFVYGGGGSNLAQLYLNDGTVYNVTDYWLVDGQLHFTTIEVGGTNAVEHTIDFSQLDLQQTVNVSAQRGFRFVLRNQPFEEYLRNHPGELPDAQPPASPDPPG